MVSVVLKLCLLNGTNGGLTFPNELKKSLTGVRLSNFHHSRLVAVNDSACICTQSHPSTDERVFPAQQICQIRCRDFMFLGGFEPLKIKLLASRQTPLTVRPASTDFRTAVIWCSVNRAFRMTISSGDIISSRKIIKSEWASQVGYLTPSSSVFFWLL